MATIIILLGGIIGFGTAITAYMAFGVSLVTAVLIWLASGPVSALLAALAIALRTPSPVAQTEPAAGSALPETA
jgi:phosphate/sulfate permease